MKKAFQIIVACGVALGVSQVATAQTTGTIDFPDVSQSLYLGVSTNAGFVGECEFYYIPTGGSALEVLGYCSTRTVDFSPPQTWNVDATTTQNFVSFAAGDTPNAVEGEEIAYIANTWGSSSSAEQAAAVNLAIWDVSEGGTGAVNTSMTGPNLALSTAYWNSEAMSDYTTIVDLAGTYASAAITNYTANGQTADYYLAERINGTPVSQDFVAPTPSPEPFTMGLGLAGIGMAVRRLRRARN